MGRAAMHALASSFRKERAGVNDGDRTRDNRYHKPALYQLSYVHHSADPVSRASRPPPSTDP